jgi:thioesterase domain-containing protein
MEIFGDFSWRRLAQRAERLRKRMIRRYSLKRGNPQMLAQYQIARFLGPAEYSESAKQFMTALYLTLQKYVPQRYDGKVLLYQALGGSPFHLHEPDRKWRKIADHLEVVPAGGTHVTLMLGKHVESLARHLNQRLAECRLWEVPRNKSYSVSMDVVAGENECLPVPLADVRQ